MRYKIGDKVRVREDIKAGIRYEGIDVVEDMLQYRGNIATIINIEDDKFITLSIDRRWYWSSEMLEHVKEGGIHLNIEMTKKENFINDRVLVYLKKNKDYGNSADDTLELFGSVAYAVRLHDKLSRIAQLSKAGAEVDDEKIEDTVLDLVNYLCMYESYGTEEYRLQGFINELTKLVEEPNVYLGRLDSLLKETSEGKCSLNPSTRLFIANYITVLTK